MPSDDSGSAQQAVRLTQGKSLPEPASISLQEIPKLKDDCVDVDEWAREVRYVLKPHHLAPLVLSMRDRPNEGDADYNKWFYWSTTIAAWLYSKLEPGVKSMLAPHLNLKNNNFNDEDDDMFADTLMKAIMHVFRGGNMASQVVNDIIKFTQMKRNSFATVRDYIVAFRKQMSIVEAHGHKITPLFAFHAVRRLFLQ
jgi:hypothetical protein